MLTDSQIVDLCKKMEIPLARVCFKDELHQKKLEFNKGYMINLDNSVDENGDDNDGSHWICLYVCKYPNGKVEPIFFDSYGSPPAESIKKFVKKGTGLDLPYNTKDIQSLLNNACGWFCCAFLHFITASSYRSQELYEDVSKFLSLFNDLNHSIDYKANEFTLKHFFRSKDPALRQEIVEIADPHHISSEDVVKIPVHLKS